MVFMPFQGASMNKADLTNRIAASARISKTKATAIVETFMGSVSAALEKGERVTLVGFGTFTTSHHKARNGRNPHTGDLITIPARRVARFSPSLKLKNVLKRK
jgi:DNA-binding protein HU-beta